MEVVTLTRAGQVENRGHTSKGNQPKWQLGEIWYKADHMGYESLAEIVASRLLQSSTVSDFVVYEPVRIRLEDRLLPGCASRNFRGKGETLIPLERLHRAYRGVGLGQAAGEQPDLERRLTYAVDFVEQVTGLENFGRYLATVFGLDAFLLNEDRHTNNLAVIRNDTTKKFRLCPLFDHGLSLLSDLTDYPLDQDVYAAIRLVKAKPFAAGFQEQAEAVVALYGSDLRFDRLGRDVPRLLAGLEELYDRPILARAEAVIRKQMRRYSYLFP